MKKTTLAIFILLLSFVAANSQTSQWSGYYSKDFQFRISFPGDPKLFTEPLDAPELKRYTYIVGDDDLAYAVMVSDLHDHKTTAAGEQAKVVGFDLNSPELVRGIPGARLLGQKTLTIDGVAARELVEEKDGIYIKIRIMYNLGRVYEVAASVKSSLAADPETQNAITKFLDSFHFKSVDLSSMPYQEGL